GEQGDARRLRRRDPEDQGRGPGAAPHGPARARRQPAGRGKGREGARVALDPGRRRRAAAAENPRGHDRQPGRRAVRRDVSVAHVVSIVYRPRDTGRPPDRYERVPVERAVLVESRGIDGDRKGSSGDRQLNVMVAEMVAELSGEGFKAEP